MTSILGIDPPFQTYTYSPGEFQSRDTGPWSVRSAATVLFGKNEVLHAGFGLEHLHTLPLHILLHLADVT